MQHTFRQAHTSKCPKVAIQSAGMNDIGEDIRRARERKHLSRERLSVDTGVSVTVIRRIETGNGGGKKSVNILRSALGVHNADDPTTTPEDSLPHVSDGALWAELQRRWAEQRAELERLRARTATPLGVTAPIPQHLLDGTVARNACLDNNPSQAAEQSTNDG